MAATKLGPSLSQSSTRVTCFHAPAASGRWFCGGRSENWLATGIGLGPSGSVVGGAATAPCSAGVVRAGRQSFAGYLGLALVFVLGGRGVDCGGGFNFCFQEFLARVYKIFIFALGLGTGLSFYGVWRLF